MQSESAPEKEELSPQVLQLNHLAKRGATMAEVAQLDDDGNIQTPAAAILALKLGNARFYSGDTSGQVLSAIERRSQIVSQHPFAIVLGCSDSRVPVEVIYDQRAGDIFVIRVAGNVVDTSTLGSIEYAVKHLNSKVVILMGHEGCGAVKAAMLDRESHPAELENLNLLIDLIVPSVEKLPQIRDQKARMREAAIANVRQQVHKLKQNPVVIAAVQNKQIQVIGAYYELSSGAVDFFETEEELLP